MKKLLLFLFIAASLNSYSQSINITYGNDSLFWVACPIGNPPVYDAYTLRADLTGFSLSDTFLVRAEFGDGTYQSYAAYSPYYLYMENGQLKLYISFNHTYLALGTYDVTYIITAQNGVSDTLFVPADVILTNSCSTFSSGIFVDNNGNCIFDSGTDVPVSNIPMTLYNGSAVYLQSFASVSVDLPLGVNFTAVVDVAAIQQLGYSMVCPLSGFVNFTTTGSNAILFAVNCNSNFDLAVHSSGHPFKIGNSALLNVSVNSVACIPQSGTYTSNFDPAMNFVLSMNAPVSGAGQVYNWNFSGLSTLSGGTGSTYNLMYCNLAPSVQMGDTLCYSFSVAPVTGDINPANNTITRCYQVLGAFDPNFKDVYPPGQGSSGNIAPATTLTYTIGFQNTGTAEAEDVYVLDTLDADLDINSLRILFASHPFQFYIISGNVIRFNFPHIMLPDSGANELLSHGYISYEIDMLPGLPNGTELANTAGIYFDDNLPVITNTTLNTIDYSLGLHENHGQDLQIYPNPASTTKPIRIELEETLRNGKLEIINNLGELIQTLQIRDENSFIEISDIYLPAGLYFLKISDSNQFHLSKLIITD